jgi:uncharacterized protein DUF6644
MGELLAGIEQLALVKGLKASFFAYPIVNALHIMSIGVLLTCVLLMDLRIVGAFGSVPAAPLVGLLRRVALVAFGGVLFTGVLLFSVRARDYAAMPIFLAKMVLVLLAGANFLAFAWASRGGIGEKPARPAVVTLALVSLALWICVLFAGRFIGFL